MPKKNTNTSESPLYLSWPYVDVNSDDEEDFRDKEDTSKSGAFSYSPTERTHNRKIALFHHVKHITVASMPSKHVSKWLIGVCKCEAADKSPWVDPKGSLFTKSLTVAIEAEAIYNILDWKDRHRDRWEQHPFQIAFQIACSPQHWCATLPAATSRRLEDFTKLRTPKTISRISTQDGYSDTDRLDQKFCTLFDKALLVVILFPRRATTSLTLHGFGTFTIRLTAAHFTRVFFGRSDPAGPSTHAPPCAGRQAYSFVMEDLAKELQDPHERFDGIDMSSRTWEFISPATFEGSSHDHDSWTALGTDIFREVPEEARQKIAMVTHENAAPCVCCLTKEGK